jgi:hypothetical protein
VNAILGRQVLPTGVLPLTSVITEVRYGVEGATVTHLDGARREIQLTEIADYVTQARNPENEHEVERVEIRLQVPLLENGLVLMDTPGIGSIYEDSSEAGRSALLEADGAIVVLSVDAPVSEQERVLLRSLAGRRARTFVVANRADHLDNDELETVRRFMNEVVADEIGHSPEVYFLAARAALSDRLAGREPGLDAVEFGKFLASFEAFVAEGLVGGLLDAARNELARVGQELRDMLTIRDATIDFDVASLARRVDGFRTAAEEQCRAVEDDRVLLDHDSDALVRDTGKRLVAFAARAPAKWNATIEDVARVTPIRHLEESLRDAVERCVRDGFETFRRQETARLEDGWRRLAERFRLRTQQRVNAVRTTAADVFAIELPEITVPEVAEERERFFYLFVRVGSSGETVSRLASRLLPGRILRRRMLAAARAQLAAEFDKHAGRARWDLAQRLDAVRRRFESAMRTELEESIRSILRAAERTDELRATAEEERARKVDDDVKTLKLAEWASSLRSA